MKSIKIIFILICLSSIAGCAQKETHNTPKPGFYLKKDYIASNKRDEENINAIGLYVTEDGAKQTYISFECQECVMMGSNWTQSHIVPSSDFSTKYEVSQDKSELIIKEDGANHIPNDTLVWISAEQFKILEECQYSYITEELKKYNTLFFNKNGKTELNNGNCFPLGCHSEVNFSISFTNNVAKISYSTGDVSFTADGEIFLSSSGDEMILLKNVRNTKSNRPCDNEVAIVVKDKEMPNRFTIFVLDNSTVEQVENEKDKSFSNYEGFFISNYE